MNDIENSALQAETDKKRRNFQFRVRSTEKFPSSDPGCFFCALSCVGGYFVVRFKFSTKRGFCFCKNGFYDKNNTDTHLIGLLGWFLSEDANDNQRGLFIAMVRGGFLAADHCIGIGTNERIILGPSREHALPLVRSSSGLCVPDGYTCSGIAAARKLLGRLPGVSYDAPPPVHLRRKLLAKSTGATDATDAKSTDATDAKSTDAADAKFTVGGALRLIRKQVAIGRDIGCLTRAENATKEDFAALLAAEEAAELPREGFCKELALVGVGAWWVRIGLVVNLALFRFAFTRTKFSSA